MRRAVEPCPVSLDRVEEQDEVGAIQIRMSHHRNRIARLVRPRSPPGGGHDADSRGLDGPCPHRDRSAAPAPTLTTMWLWGFCHRYSSTTPRYVMFLPMSNIAREWWASVGAAARAIPTATAKASNGRRARERSEGGCFGSVSVCFSADILSIDVGRAFLTLGVFRRRACSLATTRP